MKAEDMPPYRPTPERLMELEQTDEALKALLTSHEKRLDSAESKIRQSDSMDSILLVKIDALEQENKRLETMLLTLAPEVPKLTARIVELERNEKKQQQENVLQAETIATQQGLIDELMAAMERARIPRYPGGIIPNDALIARYHQAQALADQAEGNTEQEIPPEEEV